MKGTEKTQLLGWAFLLSVQTMSENRLDVYKELCSSYRVIDDFRAKLLAFLPFATGGGIFLLLNKDLVSGEFTRFFAPIGVFGFLITLGLFAYEIYGIKKCGALIMAGQQIENWLRSDGQFVSRPREPSASSMSRSRPADSCQGYWFRSLDNLATNTLKSCFIARRHLLLWSIARASFSVYSTARNSWLR